MKRRRSTATELFLRRAIPGEPGECFEWPGARAGGKYGVLTTTHDDGEMMHLVHRVAYEYFVGAIPEGQVVRHSCDNPPCWNPDHLLIGTHQDNEDDKDERGRRPVGERHPFAELTEEQVAEIRRVYAAEMRPSGWVRRGVAAELAERFGVSMLAVSLAAHGHSWRSVK